MIDQISRLLADIAELLRLRGSLARVEANRAARRAGLGAALLLGAMVLVAFTGPLSVVIMILLLSTVMPAWAAAGVMLVVSLLIAAALVLIARRLLTIRLRFLADLTEDWRTIKTRVEAES